MTRRRGLLVFLCYSFDQWHQDFFDDLRAQAVLAVEVDNVLVVLTEDILAIDGSVVVGKETIDVLAVLVRDVVKLVHLHLGVVADDFGCDGKRGFTILSRIEELESTFL